jgi:hypothetical protein
MMQVILNGIKLLRLTDGLGTISKILRRLRMTGGLRTMGKFGKKRRKIYENTT